MPEESIKKLYITTLPLKIEWTRIQNLLDYSSPYFHILDKSINYKMKEKDIEIFHTEANCIVTNEGYHIIDTKKILEIK